MNGANLFNIVTIFALVVLTLIVFLKDRKNKIHQIFAAISFCIILWIVSSFLADGALTEQTALFWAKMAIVGPFLVCPLFLYFGFIFPKGKSPLQKRHLLLIFIPPILALALAPTGYNIESVRLESWGVDFTPGWLYYVLDVFIVLYLGGGLWQIIKTYRKSKQHEERLQIRYFFIGFLSLLLIGLTTNSLLPIFFNYSKASVYGPALASLVFLGFTAYAVFKHHLLDIKVIAAEIFFSAFALFSFIYVGMSHSWQEMLVRGGIWIGVNTFGFLFLRQVLRDNKQQHQIKKQASELKQKNIYLQELLNQKTNFLTVASHILNTPISIIRGMVSIVLESKNLSSEDRKHLENAEIKGNQLADLVQKFQNIADLISNTPLFDLKPVDVRKGVEKIIKELEPLTKQRNIEVVNLVTDEIPKVFADEKTVEKIIKAIIDNGIRYNKENGKVTIRATEDSKKQMVHIKIQDNGIGLTTKEQKELFQEMYYRTKESIGLYPDGAGMSLYEAKLLANRMNGNLTAHSAGKNKGSVFTLTLPFV